MTYSGSTRRTKNLLDEIILEKMDTREWLTGELAKRCSIAPDAMSTALRSMRARRLIMSSKMNVDGTSIVAWRAA